MKSLYFRTVLILHSYPLISEQDFLEFYATIKNTLPKSLLQKIESFKFPIDQQRSLMGQLMVRMFYAEKHKSHWTDFEFEYNEQDKPSLKNYSSEFFNISHSGDWVIAVFSDQETGCDIEMAKGDRRKIAERFFTPQEITDLENQSDEEGRIKYFYQLWSLKESYMKAIGKGISMSLSSFSFSKKEKQYILDFSKYGTDWFFHSDTIEEKYFLSICSKYPKLDKEIIIHLKDIKKHLY